MSSHVSKERMNEALDGVLSASEADAIEQHVLECTPCRNEYARLSEVVAAVRALPRSALPPEETWAGIAARIGSADQERAAERGSESDAATVVRFPSLKVSAEARRRTLALSLPQLAAAAAAIAMFSAATMYVAIGGRGDPAAPEMAVEAEPGMVQGGAAARAVSLEDDRYAEVVGQLERILSEGRDVLAPETLVTIEQSLRTVDEAIADVELALATDPNSDLLRRMLSSHQRTRLGVLQRAAAAVQAQT